MSCDIHILLEVKNDNGKWELTKDEIKDRVSSIQEYLNVLDIDQKRYTEAVFNGTKEDLENKLIYYSNHPEWIKSFRYYPFFAMLSNVRNEGVTAPYVLKDNTDLPDPKLALPDNISEEAYNILTEPKMHHHTILETNKLNKLRNIIQKNFDEGFIELFEKDDCFELIEAYFDAAIERYLNKGYAKKNMRFLIAYES